MATERLRYPNAERWAAAVLAVVASDRDPRTLVAWASESAISRGALRIWCYAAKAKPRESLDFARLLRVACRAPAETADPLCLLDTVDPRTTARLLRRGGLGAAEFQDLVRRPMLFIQRQQFITTPVLIDAVRGALRTALARTNAAPEPARPAGSTRHAAHW